jgi:hypothetical protein
MSTIAAALNQGLMESGTFEGGHAQGFGIDFHVTPEPEDQ